MHDISKRDAFTMNRQQALAGKRMWQRAGQQGRLAKSSFDAEAMAPKTWILYANRLGEEISTIECELYVVGRQSDAAEALVMLHGMCPKCGETFICREDNKTMHVEYVTYRKAPKFLRVNHEYQCRHVLGRPVRDNDKIAIISSPERWMCDYCREWCVKVYDGVAKDHHRGATIVSTPHRVQRVDSEPTGPLEF